MYASMLLDPPVEAVEVLRELPVAVGQTHGVTWDGAAAWGVDAPVPRLVRVDPESGRILRSLTGFAADAGTAFDGQNLWQIGGDVARRIDPETGKVTGTLQLPDDGVSGLSWADGAFWVGNHRGKHLLRIDATSGKVLRRLESDCHVCGVTFAGGELWHCAWTTPTAAPHGWAELRRIDPETGAVMRRLRFRDWVAGIEADDQGRLWCGRHHGDKLFVFRHPGAPRSKRHG